MSGREREILGLIARGLTTTAIVATLFLSPHTARSHRDQIMAKPDLHSKAVLIKHAITRGLIEPWTAFASLAPGSAHP
ncbi:MAG: response regulator transcription factor [Chloroflexota bacterium]